ncbi:hypothetical protein Tco_0009422 [Tanacetum coccineum]
MEYVKNSIDKRALHKREYHNRVNERQMQTKEGKVDTSKALDASLVDTHSSGTESGEHDTSSKSENDALVDDADIRPIYYKEPMAEVPMTADNDIFATGQQHTEQLEFNNKGEVNQNAKQCHDTRSNTLCWKPYQGDSSKLNLPDHRLRNVQASDNDADVDSFKRCRTSCTFDDGYRVLRDLILHRSLFNNSASLSNKFGGFYFSFKSGISGLLHYVVTSLAERIRDNGTSQSKQNFQSSSTAFIAFQDFCLRQELLEYIDVHNNDASESSQPSWGKIKDNEDPSWTTSFKTRRTQKTSSALEALGKTLFVLSLYLIGTLPCLQNSLNCGVMVLILFRVWMEGGHTYGVGLVRLVRGSALPSGWGCGIGRGGGGRWGEFRRCLGFVTEVVGGWLGGYVRAAGGRASSRQVPKVSLEYRHQDYLVGWPKGAAMVDLIEKPREMLKGRAMGGACKGRSDVGCGGEVMVYEGVMSLMEET